MSIKGVWPPIPANDNEIGKLTISAANNILSSVRRESYKECMPVIQAYADGAVIEFRNKLLNEEWCECAVPLWLSEWDYRIKPEKEEIMPYKIEIYPWVVVKGKEEGTWSVETTSLEDYPDAHPPHEPITIIDSHAVSKAFLLSLVRDHNRNLVYDSIGRSG